MVSVRLPNDAWDMSTSSAGSRRGSGGAATAAAHVTALLGTCLVEEIRLNVLNVMLHWVSTHDDDFFQDKDLRGALTRFLTRVSGGALGPMRSVGAGASSDAICGSGREA